MTSIEPPMCQNTLCGMIKFPTVTEMTRGIMKSEIIRLADLNCRIMPEVPKMNYKAKWNYFVTTQTFIACSIDRGALLAVANG